MSEPKHSPGPWSLPHFAQPDVNCSCGGVLTDYMMGAVATVHCSGEGDSDDWYVHGDNPKFPQAVANARLISAAPDLLEVAHACASILPRYRMSGHTPGEDEELDAVLERVTAALVKAEAAS